MIKPASEINVCGTLLILFPFFRLGQYFILMPDAWENLLDAGFPWGTVGDIIFFGVVGIGVLKRVWQLRFAAVIFSAIGALGPFLGLFITPFVNTQIFMTVLKEYGAVVVIWKPFLSLLPNILYMLFIWYKLTRPRIKEEFNKRGRSPDS